MFPLKCIRAATDNMDLHHIPKPSQFIVGVTGQVQGLLAEACLAVQRPGLINDVDVGRDWILYTILPSLCVLGKGTCP